MLTNRLTGTTEATATTATNTQILRPAYPPLPATSGHNPKANLLAIPIRPRRRRPVADKESLCGQAHQRSVRSAGVVCRVGQKDRVNMGEESGLDRGWRVRRWESSTRPK